MADERKDVGPAMSRPRAARPVQAAATDPAQPQQPVRRPVGAAPEFDPETGQLVQGEARPGMLGNRWVRQWAGREEEREEPGEGGTESGSFDAGQAPRSGKRPRNR
jgi:hypothetical protein